MCWLAADELSIPMSPFVSWLHLRVILNGAHCEVNGGTPYGWCGEVLPGQCRPAIVGAHPSLLFLDLHCSAASQAMRTVKSMAGFLWLLVKSCPEDAGQSLLGYPGLQLACGSSGPKKPSSPTVTCTYMQLLSRRLHAFQIPYLAARVRTIWHSMKPSSLFLTCHGQNHTHPTFQAGHSLSKYPGLQLVCRSSGPKKPSSPTATCSYTCSLSSKCSSFSGRAVYWKAQQTFLILASTCTCRHITLTEAKFQTFRAIWGHASLLPDIPMLCLYSSHAM